MDKNNYKLMSSLEQNHWWFVSRKKIIRSILNIYLTPDKNKNILEIGCGSGGLLKILSNYGNLSAIELDDLSRKKALGKNICDVKYGKLPDEIPNNTIYETIFLFDVLEHIEKDKKSIKKINRLLNKGGLFILTVPAFMFLWSSHDETSHHKRRYSKEELILLLKCNGFRIKYCSYFNIFLFPLIVSFRFFNRIIGRKNNDFKKEPFIINYILKAFFSAEATLLPYFNFPFGMSIFIVCQKRNK